MRYHLLVNLKCMPLPAYQLKLLSTHSGSLRASTLYVCMSSIITKELISRAKRWPRHIRLPKPKGMKDREDSTLILSKRSGSNTSGWSHTEGLLWIETWGKGKWTEVFIWDVAASSSYYEWKKKTLQLPIPPSSGASTFYFLRTFYFVVWKELSNYQKNQI